MSKLVFVETSDGKIKGSSLEAVSYAKKLSEPVTAIAFGSIEKNTLKELGKYGAKKVLHVDDNRLDQGVIQAYANTIAQAMDRENSDTLVLAKSPLGDPVAARVAVKQDASLGSNIVDLPDTSNGFVVKQSIYTGKALVNVNLNKAKKILAIKKNAVGVQEDPVDTEVEVFTPELSEDDFKVRIVSTDKAEGKILLPEADIVVSGGRGMKGPDNWEMIEELAETLGAATACSKPVSDMEWRPHHEHVGQTGIKISPSLYIAIGISGAIQHLAGVNASKVIVVINKDPEAPFFNAADYGIVGDAFEVVPKLTKALKE